MDIIVMSTAFNSEVVLTYKSKEEWITYASVSHFVGYNETAKLKYLTHVWNEAQKLVVVVEEEAKKATKKDK
jgi:hypothetical protein